jgi:HK97 family phage prohead protease
MKTLTKAELEKELGDDRVVMLCGERPGIRGGMIVSCVAPKATEGSPVLKDTLDFIGSDSTLDRYQETIDANGWQLGNYRKNPVFQNSHKYGDVMFTLGKSLVTEVRSGALFQRIQFATDVNPMAKIAHGLYRGGYLNAVSVGFIPVKWETGAQDAPYRRKYLEQELLELSAVAVPANPNALVMGIKSGAVDISDVRELAELLKAAIGEDETDKTDSNNKPSKDRVEGERSANIQHKDVSELLSLGKEFCGDKANPGGHAGAPASGVHGARLLQLVNTCDWVLKRA